MFRQRRWAGIILALLLVPISAFASESFYGTVVCDTATTVAAPFGGTLENLTLRKGDLIRTGDQICTISTTRVYSPVAGTVSAVFGTAGDNVEDVKAWRGGVVYIVPENRFSVSATTDEGAKNPESYVSVGQTVWLRKGRRDSPVIGTGTVTALGESEESGEAGGSGNGGGSGDTDSGSSFTVEIDSGVFSPDDSVSVYRKEEGDFKALLGYGTVVQTAPVIVSGEGSILRMHVKPGSAVSRGSLLFETVAGSLNELKSGSNRVLAKTDGIVASVEAGNGTSVEQNSPLITVYPLDMMTVCVSVPETSLSLFPEGKEVSLTFGTSDERKGTVRSIDYLADVDENATPSIGYASYRVYIDFEQKDGIRQGMLVTVELP